MGRVEQHGEQDADVQHEVRHGQQRVLAPAAGGEGQRPADDRRQRVFPVHVGEGRGVALAG